MQNERTVFHIPFDDIPMSEVALHLKKHAGVELDNIPAKYGTSVMDAYDLIRSKLHIALVYQCFDIASLGEKEVVLTCGKKLTGTMAPRILKNSKQVICFVVTLPGFNDLRDSSDDVMVEYFLDTWGTVFAECGQWWLEKHLAELLEGAGQRRTYSWNPGQTQFDIQNQKPIFALLQPEEIGCILDKHMRMIPFKSTSGIMAVVDDSISPEEDLIPCDFCKMGATCPASKSRRKQ